MSSQEVVEFVHEKLKLQEQSGDPVCLSSIVEEVSDDTTLCSYNNHTKLHQFLLLGEGKWWLQAVCSQLTLAWFWNRMFATWLHNMLEV